MTRDLNPILRRLSNTEFGKAITKFSKKNLSKTLDLSYMRFSEEDVASLTTLFSCESYAKLKSLYHLESHSHSVPQRILKLFMSFLNSYDLEYVSQNVSDAKFAKLFLKYKEKITELNLTNTFIDYDIAVLAKLIKSHNFTSIKLQHNQLTSQQALELVNLIKDVPCQIHIDLSNNRLDDHFIEDLMQCLAGRIYPMEIKVGHKATDRSEYMHQNLEIGDGVLLYDPKGSCNILNFVEESGFVEEGVDGNLYLSSYIDFGSYYNLDFTDTGSLNGEYEA